MASKTKNRKENIVYSTSRALLKVEHKKRKIGAITRLLEFLKEKRKIKRAASKNPWTTRERERVKIVAAFADKCSPAYDAWMYLWDTIYNFLSRFFTDFGSLIIDIVNIFIVIGFHAQSIVLYISDWIADILYWCEGRKKALLACFVTLTVLGVAGSIFVTSVTAYEYSYYGTTLGTAKSKKIVYDTIDVVGDKLAANTGTNVSINVERDIEFNTVRGFNIKTDSADDILNTLTYMKDLQVEAFAICVDDVNKVIVEDETTARQILSDIKNEFAGEKAGVEYTDVHYEQDVTVEPVSVKLGDLWNVDDAKNYLMTGSIRDVSHVVDEHETYTEIAARYGVTVAQLQAANPGVDLESLTPGQVLSLSEPNPILVVATTEVATYFEDIQYGSQYIDNAAIYKGETEVRTPGIYGKNQIVATITRSNGKELSKEVMSKTKVSDPVDEVLYRGTKPIPEKIGTGTFALPIRNYTISSHIGWRWGRMHEGIDCAAPTGTKIYASDGGVVVFSGWSSGLGYCVKIDHGGLMTTTYGHCSRLLVSVGDQVYQGQNIALVGSTGNSTGPHLHFEVRYNGTAQNPEDYVKF